MRCLLSHEAETVVLLDGTGEDAEVIATSPLSALQDTILFVNSDLYKTGTVGLGDLELPSVLARLDDVTFRLRGYPKSEYEKLLLIVISRYIERHAWQAGDGTLRTSFQRLSRIDDERGTREVYETLADGNVQTHVYGMPDWTPSPEFGVISHGGYTDDFRDSWFVVYTPPEGVEVEGEQGESHVALLAIEVEPREWEAFWTFRPDLVTDIEEYITENL
ncbi:MAG: DICT sensory domain-containing protein [Halobacteriales archaeon]